jgi:uncharacterized protein
MAARPGIGGWPIRVEGLASTPVKGLRVSPRFELALEPGGVRDDRRLYLVEEHGRMVNGKHIGALNLVTAELAEGGRLTLAFPGGDDVSATIAHGETVRTAFYSRTRAARVVTGPFSAALSEYVGAPLRLVEAVDGSAIDRGARGGVSMISQASLAALAREAGEGRVDPRRFRMSIEIAGVDPFEEDLWVGRQLRIGEHALIQLHGHVGRCIVTSRHPETGEVDLPTLDLLRSFRAELPTTEPLPFGVYGAVLAPGLVRLGDRVRLEVAPRAP